jgi:nicotinate-nucleotide adenylyltransferase
VNPDRKQDPGPRRRVALFGGTFDPVHAGHLAVAEAAVRGCQLDQVVFLPCHQSPHKLDRSPSASAEHRLAMLELVTADLAWARVSDEELRRAPPSFSWQTAEHFHRELARAGGGRLFWILGSDQWRTLPDWARPERLAELLEFIVVPRGGHPRTELPGFRATWLDLEHPASATALRAALAAGQSPGPWLPGPVAAYIHEHRLYRD